MRTSHVREFIAAPKWAPQKNTLWKRLVGRALFTIGDWFPASKCWIKDLGLRATKEWFCKWVAKVQTADGKTFKLASIGENYLSFQLFWLGAGYYEPITATLLGELLRPCDTFVDIGANIGFFSLLLSRKLAGLKVIAFEPNPKNFELLSRNAAVNNFANIVCEPLALSDREGSAVLYLTDSDMSASLRPDFAFKVSEEVTVKAVTLDSYFGKKAPQGLLLKADAEGTEYQIFKGGQNTLRSCQPDIVTEVAVSPDPGLPALLRDCGYRAYRITDEGLTETSTLRPTVRGRYLFLNHLLSVKDRDAIRDLSVRVQRKLRGLDLSKTSKAVDDKQIERALRGSEMSGEIGNSDHPNCRSEDSKRVCCCAASGP